MSTEPAAPAPPAEPEPVIPVGPDDQSSDYEDDSQSDTTSLTSSVTKYRFENGRRYHAYKDGAYWGPNDEPQNDQLDISHHMFTLLLENKLFLAPISSKPQRVLDVGTGTGIWALDFADEFPSAEVIGTDLSPIQPSFVAPNCKFEVDDACAEWTYAPDSFDFVHVRALYGSVANWPAFYTEAFKHIKPGGWIEQLEMSIEFKSDDGTVTNDHIFSVWSRTFIEAGEMFGKTFRIADLAKGYIIGAGFDEVVEKKFKLPVGGWSSDPKYKELGRWNLLHCEQGIEGWAMALLTRVMGWKYTEVQAFLGLMRAGLRNRNTHAYYNVTVVYGRKPLENKAE
ncbi:S-adenosyl-L-methionine-dependent methyltransferase [Hyaloscypha finlandica]|nr:S-adenosyl-L-methionine-dependent methyltransferase [Hyaloscypha finlandica]